MPSTYFVHCRCTYLTQELKYTSEYKIPINDPDLLTRCQNVHDSTDCHWHLEEVATTHGDFSANNKQCCR